MILASFGWKCFCLVPSFLKGQNNTMELILRAGVGGFFVVDSFAASSASEGAASAATAANDDFSSWGGRLANSLKIDN